MDELRREFGWESVPEGEPETSGDAEQVGGWAEPTSVLPPLDEPMPRDEPMPVGVAALDPESGAEIEPELTAEAEPAPELEPELEPTVSAPSEREQRRRFALKRTGRESNPKKTKEKSDKREKRLIGLKIGASQIAAARVVNNGSPELVEAYREPLEPGVVVAGEIRDTEALAAALTRFFDLHKLPKKGVRLGLSNNRIGVRVFEIEGVTDERQLENA